MILARQGRLEEAITHFSEALRIYPDYASARQNLRESRSKQEQLDSPSN
jgi:tetratricopeptide (TPR) repeat protein